jgi:VWFA-related protein
MSARRNLQVAGVLIAGVLASTSAGADGRIAFTSPGENALLIDDTEICLDVADGEPTVDRVDVFLDGRLLGSLRDPHWCMVWVAPRESSGATLFAVAYAGDEVVDRAQRATRQVDFGQEIQVAAVQLYPVVVDRSGSYVRGLGREDFAVLDQGREVAIEGFADQPTSLTINVLLDTSDSMYDRIGLVRDAALGFVDSLDATDRVSVTAFNHTVRHVEPLSGDRDVVKEGIRSLQVGGGTALYDAVIRTLHDLDPISGRKAVFLFSDGIDEMSMSSFDDAIRTAHSSGVIIYAVGAGETARSLAARADLQELAEATGGDAHFIANLSDLPDVFAAVVAHLRSQYVMSFTPAPGPEELRPIQVRTTRPGVTVRCRSSYLHLGTE